MVWPFEGNITNERALPSARLAIAEMLRSGTTSFSDMYAFDDALITAVEESGIKCNMTHGMLAFDPEQNYWDMPECKVVDGLIERARALGDDRLKIGIGPHAEYDVCEKVMRGAAEHASQLGVGIQIHVSETQTEHEECKERHGGLTPVAYLESVGILDSPTTAAHCVWCTPDDLQILKAHDASVATCPASNLKLGSGLPNTWKFLHSGVNVAIGTDGASSNNALNMFRDMYLAAIAYRVDSDADFTVTAADVLRAATAGGAYAQRRANTGVMEVGKRADLIVLDLDLPWMQPVSHIENNVVYAATGTEVVLTMVDGKICYRDGEYLGIDIERAIAETQVARDQIVGIVNSRGSQE